MATVIGDAGSAASADGVRRASMLNEHAVAPSSMYSTAILIGFAAVVLISGLILSAVLLSLVLSTVLLTGSAAAAVERHRFGTGEAIVLGSLHLAAFAILVL